MQYEAERTNMAIKFQYFVFPLRVKFPISQKLWTWKHLFEFRYDMLVISIFENCTIIEAYKTSTDASNNRQETRSKYCRQVEISERAEQNE